MVSKFSLVVKKNGRILIKSKERGLFPLVKCLKENDIVGSTVFDRIVGSAAARLFVHARVKKVCAGIASRKAIEILKKNKINAMADKVVENIVNKHGDVCMFEKMSAKFRSNERFYKGIVKRLKL